MVEIADGVTIKVARGAVGQRRTDRAAEPTADDADDAAAERRGELTWRASATRPARTLVGLLRRPGDRLRPGRARRHLDARRSASTSRAAPGSP